MKKPAILKYKLNHILDELNRSHESTHELIEAILIHCPGHLYTTFTLHCALDVKHLLTDKRSLDALEAVKVYLEKGKGKAVPRAVINDAANAAYAVNVVNVAAAYAAYATACAAHATVYAAYVADQSASCFPNREEKLTEYLNKLKELILEYVDEQDKSDILELCL